LISRIIEGRIIIHPSSSGCTEEFLIVLGHFIPKLKSLLIFQILSRKFLLPSLQSKIALSEGYDTPLTASGILILGSVVLAAEARALFGRP